MKRTDMVKEMERTLGYYKGYKVEEMTDMTKSIIATIYTNVYLIDKYKKDRRKNITGWELGEVMNAYMASTIVVLDAMISRKIGIQKINEQLEQILEKY